MLASTSRVRCDQRESLLGGRGAVRGAAASAPWVERSIAVLPFENRPRAGVPSAGRWRPEPCLRRLGPPSVQGASTGDPDDAQLHVLEGLSRDNLGRQAEAIASDERGGRLLPVSRDAVNGSYIEHRRARLSLLAGERDKALDVLARLLKIPYYLSPEWFRIDPDFASLRG